MLVAALFLTSAPLHGLPKAEIAMLDALKSRNVTAVKRLMKKQISFFSVFSASKKEAQSDLPENYIIASAQIQPSSNPKEVRVSLERISQLIATSTPTLVRSIHNDLTANTIQGKIKPGIEWEIHYNRLKNGHLIIQRICEFHNAPRFHWPSKGHVSVGEEKKLPNSNDLKILKALKQQNVEELRPRLANVNLIWATTQFATEDRIEPEAQFSASQQETLLWTAISFGKITKDTSDLEIRRQTARFSDLVNLYESKKGSPLDQGYMPYAGGYLQYCGRGKWLSITLKNGHNKSSQITELQSYDGNVCFEPTWFNQAP